MLRAVRSWHECWELNLGSLQEQGLWVAELNFQFYKYILSPVTGWVFSHLHKKLSSDHSRTHSKDAVGRKVVSWKLLCTHTQSHLVQKISALKSAPSYTEKSDPWFFLSTSTHHTTVLIRRIKHIISRSKILKQFLKRKGTQYRKENLADVQYLPFRIKWCKVSPAIQQSAVFWKGHRNKNYHISQRVHLCSYYI